MSVVSRSQLVVMRNEAVVAHERPALASEADLARLVDDYATAYPDAWVMADWREEDLVSAWCREPHALATAHAVFYNDFDDYEDDVELGSPRWLGVLCARPPA